MKTKIVTGLLACCILLGCERDELPFYQGGKGLVMGSPSGSPVVEFSYINQATFSYSGWPYNIPLVLIGADEGDTAVNYRIRFLSDDLHPVSSSNNPIRYSGKEHHIDRVFRSGSQGEVFELNIYRDSAYMDTVYALRLLLETEPAYEMTGLAEHNGRGYVRELEFRIDDRFEEPVWWADYVDYIGTFTSRKMRELTVWLGLRYERMPNLAIRMESEIAQDPMTFGMRFKQFLEERAAAGNPVLERDGTPMRAGPAVYE